MSLAHHFVLILKSGLILYACYLQLMEGLHYPHRM